MHYTSLRYSPTRKDSSPTRYSYSPSTQADTGHKYKSPILKVSEEKRLYEQCTTCYKDRIEAEERRGRLLHEEK